MKPLITVTDINNLSTNLIHLAIGFSYTYNVFQTHRQKYCIT